ncbi:YibE/F family protein [Candidatus Beckwithbacteria bacterium]|nr:YibE/F family protein [Candidatus Beckwithbacteria bacterium]
MKKIILTILVLLFFFFHLVSISFAQDNVFKNFDAEIIDVISQKNIQSPYGDNIEQVLKIQVNSGELKGQIIDFTQTLPAYSPLLVNKNDQVILNYDTQNKIFNIADFQRKDPLLFLFVIFLILVFIIAKKKGIMSLLGLVFSFFIIFYFLLPMINRGYNAILISIISAFFIAPATFYLAHGFNRKTSIALIGTFISLIITSILASIFIAATKLTGFASEEAGFLLVQKGNMLNIKSLILTGIIIGVLGILDDITIAQTGIVIQLKNTAKNISSKELYQKSLSIGQDHIASMVNTLILVYAGASLPLLLLFINNPSNLNMIINYEIIAEEIVRTLVASIGLILAVPITTFLSCFFVKKSQ